MQDEEFNKLIVGYSPELREAIRNTKQKGIEHGFLICKKKGKYRVKSKCSGDACSLESLEYCKGKDEKTIASFHTHPRGMLLPTPEDIAHSYGQGEKYFCIGNTKTVRCWKIADYNPVFENMIEMTLRGDTSHAGSLVVDDIIRKRGEIVKQTIQFEP